MLCLLLLTLRKDQRTQRLSHFNQLQHVLQREGLNGPWALVYATLPGHCQASTPSWPCAEHSHGPTAEQSSGELIIFPKVPAEPWWLRLKPEKDLPHLLCMVCRSHSLCWQGRARCQWKGLGRMLPHCSFHPLWPWRALQGQGDLQPSGCAEMAARPLQVAYLDMLVSYNFQAAPGTPLHHQGTSAVPLYISGEQGGKSFLPGATHCTRQTIMQLSHSSGCPR